MAAVAVAAEHPVVKDTTRDVTSHSSSMKISLICVRYNPEEPERSRLRLPEFQRQWAWKGKNGLAKKQGLIDSILHGYPIPPLILNHVVEDLNDYWDVYDGRHRIETIWQFKNNKFGIPTIDGDRLVKFEELSPEDQNAFLETEMITVVTENTPEVRLSEIFIRLNGGKPLSDKDLIWASKGTPLVRDVIDKLSDYADRFHDTFLLDVSTLQNIRKSGYLTDFVGLMYGLSTGSAGDMSCSYMRMCRNLSHRLNIERVNAGLDAMFALFNTANELHPFIRDNVRKIRSQVKLGTLLPYYFHDRYQGTADEYAEIDAKWVTIIGFLRRNPDTILLKTSGAQNLNIRKVTDVVRRVNIWWRGDHIPGVTPRGEDTAAPPLVDSDDSDDESA
jgi:hypothetical protein